MGWVDSQKGGVELRLCRYVCVYDVQKMGIGIVGMDNHLRAVRPRVYG